MSHIFIEVAVVFGSLLALLTVQTIAALKQQASKRDREA